MPEYDFKSLSPYDFEILSRDLLQRELGVHLQSFKTGRDKGIDLRYAPATDKSLVIQCKHYSRSSFSTLLSQLRKNEVPKVHKLVPARYLFVTSLALTPGNVDKIFSLFKPYCKSRQDIYGQGDLNNLLTKYPDVEKAHFKLWLTSTSVLERIMHNAIYVQSELDLHEIRSKLEVYVEVDSLRKAADILETTHVCIVSGIPGIGKTTLAQILLTNYLMNDWEIVAVRQNVREALERFSPDQKKRQVFWYDDFLGQVAFGEKLAKNEDRTLVQLMDSAAKHPNRRFILTTREYILKQALQQHEVLSHADLDPKKHVLLLSDYSREQKARILLNHLYFYEVPGEHIHALLADRTYIRIIDHKNYSPRIIEWLTDTTGTGKCPPKEYPSHFMAALDQPISLWKHAFENQISEEARHLLLVLVSVGQEIVLGHLASAFESFRESCSRRYHFSTAPQEFERALRELEGTFVTIGQYKTATTVALHNPSITDFLVHFLKAAPQYVQDVIETAVYFDQALRIITLLTGGDMEPEAFEPLVRHNEAIADAVERTLESSSILFATSSAYTGPPRLYMMPEDICVRLATSVWLADRVTIPSFQEGVLERVRSHVAQVAVLKPNRLHLIDLLDETETGAWVAEDVPRALFRESKEYLLDTPYAWEELRPVAAWVAGHSSWIDESERDDYIDRIAGFVSDEAYGLATDTGTSDGVDELQYDLRKISDALGVDFDHDIDVLEDYRSELGPSEEDCDRDDEFYGGSAVSSCETNIEAMFDSLRE